MLFVPPQYELLFCIGEKYNAPSQSIIAELLSQYPDVDAKVFQGERDEP